MKNKARKTICVVLLLVLAAGLCSCAASGSGNNSAQDNAAESGSTAESQPSQEDIPVMRQDEAFIGAKYFRVSWREHGQWPAYYLFTDSASLSAYYLSQCPDRAEDAKKDIAAYDDAWFKTHQLIVVPVDEGSGSVRHKVLLVTEKGIVINRLAPEVGTADMASWRIFIELDRSFSADGSLKVEFVSIPMDGKSKAGYIN